MLFIPASYDPDKQKALESMGFWRGGMAKAFFEVNFPDPRKIEESAQVVVGIDTSRNRHNRKDGASGI